MKIAVMILTALLISPVSAQISGKSVEELIYCPCGCGEILANCHCETATEVKKDIQGKILAGSKPEDVLSEYVKIYGANILVRNEEVARSKSDETLYLYLAGIGVTAAIAYAIGKSSRKSEDWKVKKR
ncbi:cytochrome c-type biogenesis protein CcmH [Ferroglobus sp.]|uniref:cytochrome c-type biogenesis protein CcmH n=1 Tax=Ferroglobus sp. TaxID=2614230 RepID=UPI0025B7AF79|nr:cytochrome c-type biogenesis protein CcmH [Ferroglobus sp.]